MKPIFHLKMFSPFLFSNIIAFLTILLYTACILETNGPMVTTQGRRIIQETEQTEDSSRMHNTDVLSPTRWDPNLGEWIS